MSQEPLKRKMNKGSLRWNDKIASRIGVLLKLVKFLFSFDCAHCVASVERPRTAQVQDGGHKKHFFFTLTCDQAFILVFSELFSFRCLPVGKNERLD